MAEAFSKHAFFNRPRGDSNGIENQWERPFVFLAVNARHVQYGHQLAVWVKDGGRRTAKLRVPAAKMLVAMHQHRTFLGNGCSNPVGAFRLLRPNAAHPDAPTLELVCVGLVSAVMNSNSIAVTEENDVAVGANDRIEPVDLLLSEVEHVFQRFAKNLQFALCNDVRRRKVIRFDAIVNEGSSPRAKDFLGFGKQVLARDVELD